MRRSILMTTIPLAVAAYAAAQVATPPATPPASQAPPPTLTQIGMVIYPAQGQTPDQQKAWRGMTGEPYTFLPTFAPPR